MLSWIARHLSLVVFIASSVALVFMAGLTLGYLRLPPANLVRHTIAAARDLGSHGKAYLGFGPTKHLKPRRFAEDGLVTSDPERTAAGVTFMTGVFGNTLGARLYASDGSLIHEWPINFFHIAPDEMRYPFEALIHGDYLYPNGDFLGNLDGRGIVRVSACGEIVWQNRDRSHHALFVDEGGFLWTPIYAPQYDMPALVNQRFGFDRVAKFDPDTGEKLDEFDLAEALVQAQLQGLALTNRIHPGDIMHLNDVEVLSAEMEAAFPGFSAGDLLLSSRHFNQIWVLDGATRQLKWWHIGPMIGQHDPDFQPDGTITLLDNRPGPEPGRSRILKIDPSTRGHETVYTSDEDNTFYTPFRGKHQVLENGNVLITETDAGRAFEVTESGEVVWSFVNGYDETRVGWIMSATRYPPEYAAIGEIPCPDRSVAMRGRSAP